MARLRSAWTALEIAESSVLENPRRTTWLGCVYGPRAAANLTPVALVRGAVRAVLIAMYDYTRVRRP
jgi:hypothetical protein